MATGELLASQHQGRDIYASNGLTVTLHQDKKTPIVAVHVTYNVGSKDDPPGRSGLAHLFEHLMFEGSVHTIPAIIRRSTSTWQMPGRDRERHGLTITRR